MRDHNRDALADDDQFAFGEAQRKPFGHQSEAFVEQHRMQENQNERMDACVCDWKRDALVSTEIVLLSSAIRATIAAD